MKTLKIIDPYEINKHDCPVFIQSADTRSFLGWGIRKRTKSWWNHSMIMRVPEKLVSQNNTYREIDVGVYMGHGRMMKFWVCHDITVSERNAIMIKLQRELNKPWYKRLYDYPGIIGQLFGLRWINIPSLNYCSERVSSKIRVILPEIAKHPTPEDIDNLFKESSRMSVLGYYVGV